MSERGLYPPLPVLLVDDDEMAMQNYRLLLRTEGITNVIHCPDSREVLPMLKDNDFETIILDLIMPYISGEDLLKKIIESYPAIPIIVITAIDDTQTIVQCVKQGAFDFIVKPVTKNRLITTLKRSLQLKKLERENISLKQSLLSNAIKYPDAFSNFNTKNLKMQSIFRYMEVISSSSEPVLISGETGSGKELIAKSLYKLCCEKKGQFISVNVAGLDDQLFTDTLFGHLKGAFTDAQHSRNGLVEQAENGILFLDEIGDLSMASQVKLLRLIQEKEYYPIGSDLPKRSNARVVVSTNRDLEEMQQKGEFRKDLYYRLKVHHIKVPPLRERKEDIPLLVDHFFKKASEEAKKKAPRIPQELYTLLSNYHFPGNIRELRGMVYDAIYKHTSKKMSLKSFKQKIENTNKSNARNGWSDLPKINNAVLIGNEKRQPWIQFSQQLPTLKLCQELLIREALKRSKNNQSIAAQLLGVTRQALNRRVKDMDI